MSAEPEALRREIGKALDAFPDMPVPGTIPETLPLMERLRARQSPPSHDGPVLFIQHQLGHFPARLSAGIEDGLDPERTWLLDIPYSTNAEVYGWIAARFGPDRLVAPLRDSLAAYYPAQGTRLSATLERIDEACGDAPLLVVDDGGYFVKHVMALWERSSREAEAYRGARVVEQTTRGHWALESAQARGVLSALEIRAVSVARSRTKVLFEAPFIGAAIARRVADELEERRLTPTHALIMGFGSVGSACARALGPDGVGVPHIDVVEKDPEKRSSAQSAGFQALEGIPDSDRANYDLVLGCTGGTSFKPGDRHVLRNHAVLASGSSASVEFDRENWVDEADRDSRDALELVGDREAMRSEIHSDMTFRFEDDRELTILNSGFPINFDGHLTHLPTVAIEPTHCLLHAAVSEVSRKSTPGLAALDGEVDSWLLREAVAGLSTRQ